MRMRLVLAVALLLVACNKPDSGGPAPAASAAAPLKEGDPAPDVDMTMQDGRHVKLSSLKGQNVVVYFYPKDETPGCTAEAENFRDRFADLKQSGITVIGVSTQDAASHKAFIEKEKLPFDLAVDEDRAIAKAFGVPTGTFGMHARQTFLVGKDGRLKKIWREVKPREHAAEVLAAAQS